MTDLILSEAKLVSRFTVIGVLATLTHLGTSFFVLALTALPVQAANFCGFAVAVCVSYLGHYHFSFKSTKQHRVAMTRFLATTLTAYACNVLTVATLTFLTSLPENICLLCGVGIMPVISFVLSRIWVY